MESTFTLALSLTKIKQDVSAQCAWVDITNLTTLPPIVNPSDSSDLDTAIMTNIFMICNRLSGYITDTFQNDVIFQIEIMLPGFSTGKTSSLLQLINEYVTYGTLAELYSTQKQASHIMTLFQDKHNSAIRRIMQLLAYTN